MIKQYGRIDMELVLCTDGVEGTVRIQPRGVLGPLGDKIAVALVEACTQVLQGSTETQCNMIPPNGVN